MRWNKQFPTISGYYWLKCPGMFGNIVFVKMYETCAGDGMDVYAIGTDIQLDCGEGCEWAGPIPAPEN